MPTLPEIIGEPGSMFDKPVSTAPESSRMREEIIRTMPIISIHPMTSQSHSGTEIFTLKNANDEYIKYLKNADITVPESIVNKGIKVMYQHTSPISENYSSNFSSSAILDGMSNGSFSQTAQDLMQISGKDFNEFVNSAATKDGIVGSAAKGFNSLKNEVKDAIGHLTSNSKLQNQLGQMIDNPDRKIDFPMLWRSSGYSQTYSFNVRLYNPFPRDDKSYGNLIVAPLAALLAFTLPRSTDGGLYKWPFLCKVSALGRFNMRAAYIQSISVIKGGDTNDFGYNLRPNLIDLQINFASLYNVMLMIEDGEPESDAPTLKREVSDLMSQRKVAGVNEVLGPENAHIQATTSGTRFPFSVPSNIQTTARQAARVLSSTRADITAASRALNAVADSFGF